MRYLIVGCGRVGSTLAKLLDADGHEVIVVDEDPNAFKRLGQKFKGHVVVGTGIDYDVLKHAGDSHATVRVRYTSDSLELEITDNGRGRGDASMSGGHGLVGMRERVALYGGQFRAGERPDGGFGVHVLLPVR